MAAAAAQTLTTEWRNPMVLGVAFRQSVSALEHLMGPQLLRSPEVGRGTVRPIYLFIYSLIAYCQGLCQAHASPGDVPVNTADAVLPPISSACCEIGRQVEITVQVREVPEGHPEDSGGGMTGQGDLRAEGS